MQAKQASWLVQRILKAYKHLQPGGYTEQILTQMEQYSIKYFYGKMRGDMEKVKWRKLVWAYYGSPKWLFILYMALNRRLSTRNKVENFELYIASMLACYSLIITLANKILFYQKKYIYIYVSFSFGLKLIVCNFIESLLRTNQSSNVFMELKMEQNCDIIFFFFFGWQLNDFS